MQNIWSVVYLLAGTSGGAVYGVSLRSLTCWECGFESHRGHGSLLWVLCVVWYGSLQRANHSYKGVRLTVVRRCVWSGNLVNEEALVHWGLLRQKKERKKERKKKEGRKKVDLLRRNPHWWSPVISSAYGVSLDSMMWDTILFVVIVLFINRYNDRLLPPLRQFLLIPDRINKFMNLRMLCYCIHIFQVANTNQWCPYRRRTHKKKGGEASQDNQYKAWSNAIQLERSHPVVYWFYLFTLLYIYFSQHS